MGEADFKRNTQRFNIRYIAFKKQLTELAEKIKDLEHQNQAKDQLLMEKAKDIMAKTMENVKLKNEIKDLKHKISSIQTAKMKRNKSCPLYASLENTSNAQDVNKHHFKSNTLSLGMGNIYNNYEH